MRAVKDIVRSVASGSDKYWNFFSKKMQRSCQRLAE